MLVGERLEVETPHPRAAAKRLAERLDGRRLEAVEALGKNLLLRFEGGVVLRSHLRMTGRWWVQRAGARRSGRPWLVLRGREHEALQWNGPVLELGSDVARQLGPDVLAAHADLDAMLVNLRHVPQSVRLGEALLRQRLVAGIGTVWMAEALWHVRLSPWLPLAEVSDDELREALGAAGRLMRQSLEGGRQARQAYGRAGRPCRRCGALVRARGQGDDNRTAHWCPGCQRGDAPAEA